MTILLDTDVLIDVALNRRPHVDASAKLLDFLEHRKGMGYLAWHSVANLYYLVAPVKGAPDTRLFIEDMMNFIRIAPATEENVRYACQLPMRDFEDALQVVAAMASNATVIATRNVRDYVQAPVRAANPSTILTEIN